MRSSHCFTFLHRWPLYLANKGYAPTSVKNMLNNVWQFLKHVNTSFLRESKLRDKDFTKLFYELKRIQSEVTRKVVVHRQGVLRRKTGKYLHSPRVC